MKWIVVLVMTLALAACEGDPLSPGPSPEFPAGTVQLETSDLVSVQGHWSGYEDPVRTLITDEEAWTEAWDRIHAHLNPSPSAPSVDFGNSVIVLAAMGTRPTTGYAVTIEEVHRHEHRLLVMLTERSPGPRCLTGQALTAPVHAVQVTGMAGQAEFEVREGTVGC
jgi:hypothetical protein